MLRDTLHTKRNKRAVGLRSWFARIVLTLLLSPGVIGGANELDPVDLWIEALESDTGTVRRMATERLRHRALEGDRQHAEVIQAVARRSLTNTLETQAITLSLLRSLRQDRLDRQLQQWLQRSQLQWTPSDPPSDWPDHVDRQWKRFSRRAGTNADSTRVFCGLISNKLNGHASPAANQLVWHLGCRVPDGVHLYRVDGQYTRDQLITGDDSICRWSTPTNRVLAWLIDDAIDRNPYGWTVRDRLHIAWIHRRRDASGQICDRVFSDSKASPMDQAYALLAAQRWPHADLSDRLDQRLLDARLVRVSPTEAIWIRRPPAPANGKWRGSIVDTRLQDVAVLLMMNRRGIDARLHGMDALQADPVWGTSLPSIGFISQAERDAAIRLIDDLES